MKSISCSIHSLGALWVHDCSGTVIKEDLNNRNSIRCVEAGTLCVSLLSLDH